MTLRVAMVVDRFPNEPFLARQVAALLERSVDVQVLCQILDRDSDAWEQLEGLDLDGRIHPWPDRGHNRSLALATARAVMTAVRRRGIGSVRPFLRALRVERAGTGEERSLLGRLLFDLRVLAIAPDVLHFQFGDLARARSHVGPAVDAAFTSSFRGYDLAYAGLENPDFYADLWPVLDGAHTLGRDLLVVAGQRGAPAELDWTIISPAVEVERFDPPDRRSRQGGTDEPLRILSVGRLHWKKGLVDGLVAVAQLVADGRSVAYRIVGDGPAEEQLRWTIADLGLEGSVELVGRCRADEVRRQLAWADVFLHPSHSEGFANAVLEAQAMALPVVCTDAEGLQENVAAGRTALVVPRRHPAALAEALGLLADHPERRIAMGEAGRRRVVDGFGLEAQTDAFVEFFAASAERARRRDR